MFLLKLHLLPAKGGELILRGQMSSDGEGRQPDFRVSVQTGGHEEWNRAVLPSFPRWCEPVQAFVARALAALPDQSGLVLEPLSTLKLEVRDFHRSRKLVLSASARYFPEDVGERPEPASCDPWRLIARQCANEAFGQVQCPAVPGELRPRIYEAPSGKCVRSSELSLEIQMAANWVLGTRAKPADVPNRDAIGLDAFNAFLNNEVDIPRPALGWLWP